MGATDSGTLTASSRPETYVPTGENSRGPILVYGNLWTDFIKLGPSGATGAVLNISVEGTCQLVWDVIGTQPDNYHCGCVNGEGAYSFQVTIPPYGETLQLRLNPNCTVNVTLRTMTDLR